MRFGNSARSALLLCGLLALAACMETAGGNSALNAPALERYATEAARSGLDANRQALVGCVAVESLRQRAGGVSDPSAAMIAPQCAGEETAYRASVMAHVREEWQNPSVMSNTANTAVANLYAAVLEAY